MSRGPIVVVGAGIAGLSVAIAAAPADVVLLDAGGLNSSRLAQGGIAAAIGPGDSVGSHLADTLVAGAMHNDVELARKVLSSASGAIRWLQAMGVAFDRGDPGLHLGREGGHAACRIVHAGGDRTGEHVVSALRDRVRAAGHVDLRDGVDVDALLIRGERVAGVRILRGDGEHEMIEAGAVVLATGGIGALFERTTNAAGNTGTGLVLSMAAGARVTDLELVQFHPTALNVGWQRLPLVTEALRGAGAHLIDTYGRRLMAGVHRLGDLAPRDVVARRVWEAAHEGSVWLDATGTAVDWERLFPTVMAACAGHGIDPRLQPIPVTAAAHFHMGGIATDATGCTSILGLHAVGEAACNGFHGANRLASNSLLEGVVCGRWLGCHLRQHRGVGGVGAFRLVERGPALGAEALSTLRTQMWEAAGPVRRTDALERAAAVVSGMAGWEARVAAAILAAARRRRRSLGAHWLEAA